MYVLFNVHLINSSRYSCIFGAQNFKRTCIYTRPCRLQAQRVLHFSASLLEYFREGVYVPGWKCGSVCAGGGGCFNYTHDELFEGGMGKTY